MPDRRLRTELPVAGPLVQGRQQAEHHVSCNGQSFPGRPHVQREGLDAPHNALQAGVIGYNGALQADIHTVGAGAG